MNEQDENDRSLIEDAVEDARRHSIAARRKSWLSAASEVTQKGFAWAWKKLDPAAHQIARFAKWTAPHACRAAEWAFSKMAYKTNEDGTKQFSYAHLGINTIKVGIVSTITPIILYGAYNYATWETYPNVLVTNTSHNQQFIEASKQAGKTIASRDEIFSVFGEYKDKDGEAQPIRFDIDGNLFFSFYHDAIRPDLAFTKISNGAVCTFEAQGIYARLPRPWRIRMLRWLDFRPEIVKVVECTNLRDQLNTKMTIATPARSKDTTNKNNLQFTP